MVFENRSQQATFFSKMNSNMCWSGNDTEVMERRGKHDRRMKDYYGLCLGQNIEALSNTGMVCKTLYYITDIFVGLQKKYF